MIDGILKTKPEVRKIGGLTLQIPVPEPEPDPAESFDQPELKFIRLSEDNWIRKWINYQTHLSGTYPDYAFASALAMIAVITDKIAVMRFRQGRFFTNLWLFCLGISTLSMKSTAVNKGDEMLWDWFDNGVGKLPADGSPEGIFKSMSDVLEINEEKKTETVIKHSHRYLILEEAAGLLASLEKPYMAAYRDFLLRLYSSTTKSIIKELADGKNKKTMRFVITDPYLNFLLATTPSNFAACANPVDLTSGFLYRFLFFFPNHFKKYRSMEYEGTNDIETERNLGHELQEISELLKKTRKNFPDGYIPFKMNDEGKKIFDDWAEQKYNKLFSNKNDIVEADVEGAMLARLQENLYRLIMLFKIADPSFKKYIEECGTILSMKDPVGISMFFIPIEKEFIEEAIHLIDNYFISHSRAVIELVGRDINKNIQEKILAYLKGKGKAPIRLLYRALHIEKKYVELALEALQLSEEIYWDRKNNVVWLKRPN